MKRVKGQKEKWLSLLKNGDIQAADKEMKASYKELLSFLLNAYVPGKFSPDGKTLLLKKIRDSAERFSLDDFANITEKASMRTDDDFREDCKSLLADILHIGVERLKDVSEKKENVANYLGSFILANLISTGFKDLALKWVLSWHDSCKDPKLTPGTMGTLRWFVGSKRKDCLVESQMQTPDVNPTFIGLFLTMEMIENCQKLLSKGYPIPNDDEKIYWENQIEKAFNISDKKSRMQSFIQHWSAFSEFLDFSESTSDVSTMVSKDKMKRRI